MIVLLILHKKIQFYIFMFEAWNVAKGRKVQGGRIQIEQAVFFNIFLTEKDAVAELTLQLVTLKCYFTLVLKQQTLDRSIT